MKNGSGALRAILNACGGKLFGRHNLLFSFVLIRVIRGPAFPI